MSHETDSHFEFLSELSIPSKRAAYSDRMALMMALLANIAYERFDEESDDILMTLAKELAELSAGEKVDAHDLKKKLQELAVTLASVGKRSGKSDNYVLKAALEVGGFTLVGDTPIHIPETDTQAIIVVREATEYEQAFAVLCFRGTQEIRDWLTNVKATPIPIEDPINKDVPIGNMHKGFHDAYISAEPEILKRLEMASIKNLPLYITGHSLGGALAVVATWYLSSKRLAACYTFGAPRVGDAGLLGRYKTPIYRIVNVADPVPFVPPSGAAISGAKVVLRFLASIAPWGGWLDRAVSFMVKQQNFRHYGDMKYLPFATPINGQYSADFRIHPSLSSSSRLFRYVRMFFVKPINDGSGISNAKPDRVDQYHGMDRYCAKLRAVAKNRNS